jgi:bile acid:Na+ symporter, BASS family
MLGMGTTLTFDDFGNVLKQPYLVGLGALLQYTIMPSLGFMISRTFGLPDAIAAGVILVSCCPVRRRRIVLYHIVPYTGAGGSYAYNMTPSFSLPALAPPLSLLYFTLLFTYREALRATSSLTSPALMSPCPS